MALAPVSNKRERGSIELCAGERRFHPSWCLVLLTEIEREREREMAEEKQAADEQEHLDAAARVRPLETLLRAAPLVLCVAAMAVMLRNRQSNEYGSVSYVDLSGFRYLVCVNGLCALYALASAFYTAVPRRATRASSWAVFLLDQVDQFPSPSLCVPVVAGRSLCLMP
jgi:hypothetical protein